MRRPVILAFVLLVAASMNAATKNNDDSCDISTLPAATLLVPYFEVDLENVGGETTLFTIANVTNVDRIARVTLWTDFAYPVIAFNIYLTGYDVQAINLYDVIQRGVVAPDDGTGTAVTKRGSYSDPNHEIDVTGCTRLPGTLDPVVVERMQSAFTLGFITAAGSVARCASAGGTHDNAVGYATIDVVRTCSSHLPTEPAYWTEDIAFENVLTGDYQQVDSTNNYAQSNSLVHVRAIPEGGTPAERRARPQDYANGFQRTFYSRYQAASEPRFDGRQPLPSAFAARWIQGGSGSFQTSYKIWRENRADGRSCSAGPDDGDLPFYESVRFDEAENAVASYVPRFPNFRFDIPLPATSRTRVSDADVYPQLTNGAVAGWLYLNLDRSSVEHEEENDPFPSQNWVVTSMRAEGRYSGDMDATAMGNGCSPKFGAAEPGPGDAIIGPAENVNP